MNVFDFDGTIMHGDTEDYFQKYCYEHFKIKWRYKIKIAFYHFFYKLKIISAQTYRNNFYPYIKDIPNLDKVLIDFWDIHEKDIFPYYQKIHQDDDVVISATPRIFLEEIIKRLKIKTLIASELDLKTTKIVGKLCRAEEKVVRYNKIFHEKPIENYYFDQDHDMYVMKYAKNGYRVYDGELKKVK